MSLGAELSVPISLSIAPELRDPIQISVISGQGLFHIRIGRIGRGQNRRPSTSSRRSSATTGEQELVLRATALRDGRWPVVSDKMSRSRFKRSNSIVAEHARLLKSQPNAGCSISQFPRMRNISDQSRLTVARTLRPGSRNKWGQPDIDVSGSGSRMLTGAIGVSRR